jgi:hypothetical protein
VANALPQDAPLASARLVKLAVLETYAGTPAARE